MRTAPIQPLTSFDEASLDKAFNALSDEVRSSASKLVSAKAKEEFRLDWLGRKQGRLKDLSEVWLKPAPISAKKYLGIRFNELKLEIEALLAEDALVSQSSGNTGIDISLPGTRRSIGVEHPLTRTMREMTAVFAALGYSVGIGPEVETDFYNFEALNFPPNHPARDTQDTLWSLGRRASRYANGC